MAKREKQLTPEEALALSRELATLQLRLAGHSYGEIALHMGMSKGGAYKAVKRALAKTLQEPADDVRQIELARLDALLMAHWQLALAGIKDSTELVLKIMGRRARMMGLDAPVMVDISSMIGDIATAAGLDPATMLNEANAIYLAHKQQPN